MADIPAPPVLPYQALAKAHSPREFSRDKAQFWLFIQVLNLEFCVNPAKYASQLLLPWARWPVATQLSGPPKQQYSSLRPIPQVQSCWWTRITVGTQRLDQFHHEILPAMALNAIEVIMEVSPHRLLSIEMKGSSGMAVQFAWWRAKGSAVNGGFT